MKREHRPLRVWVDVENAPQVQYLAPLAEAFAERGDEVVVTARDHGIALELLRERGLPFRAVGAHGGSSGAGKAVSVLQRAAALGLCSARRRPSMVVGASRPAALAALGLRVPSFTIVDYEFVELRSFRLARTNVLHPRVVGEALRARGVAPERLVPFEGLKEDITFAGRDLGAVEPYPLEAAADLARVLVRPPDDRSHYHADASSELTRAVLEHLASRADVLTVVSPRYPEQLDAIGRLDWRIPPVLLARGVPFLPLLRAVDAVVSAGGTMAREAAYLGIPAYTTFGGRIGAVDRHLVQLGRLRALGAHDEIAALRFERVEGFSPLAENPRIVQTLVSAIVERCGR